MRIAQEIMNGKFAMVDANIDEAMRLAGEKHPAEAVKTPLARLAVIQALCADHFKRMGFIAMTKSVKDPDAMIEMVKEASSFLALVDAVVRENEKLSVKS